MLVLGIVWSCFIGLAKREYRDCTYSTRSFLQNSLFLKKERMNVQLVSTTE